MLNGSWSAYPREEMVRMDRNSALSKGMRKTNRKIAALFLIVVAMAFVGVAMETDYGLDAYSDEEKITYNPNGATYDNGDPATSITIGYDGIKSTEYNPEYWKDTGNLKTNNLINGNNTNWIGPKGTKVTIDGSEIGWVILTFENNLANVKYTINFPNSEIKYKSIIYGTATFDSESDSDTITYKQGAKGTTKIAVYFVKVEITPNKVFGGWLNGDEIILPGDVVDNSVTALKANWITPDIFILKKDYVDWEYCRNSNNQKLTVTNISVVSDYANLGLTYKSNDTKDGKTGMLDYKTAELRSTGVYEQMIKYSSKGYEDRETQNKGLISVSYKDENNETQNVNVAVDSGYGVQYSKVIRGDGRQESYMFGTIYHLTKERTKAGYNYTNIGSLSSGNTNIAKMNEIPCGTYRTPSPNGGFDNYAFPFLVFNSDEKAQEDLARLSGNVIFDNVSIRSTASSSHGNTTGASLFAYGHILIMGSNIKCAGNENSGLITYSNDKVNGAPQIFGGTNGARSATNALYDIVEPVKLDNNTVIEKKIVFGDGRDTDNEENNIPTLKVELGTLVIVHSGIYSNIIGGSYGRVDIGTENRPLSTYVVLKGGSTLDTIVGGGSLNDNKRGHANPTIYGDKGTADAEHPENTGGSFLYVIDHFTPGDDWEDTQSGCMDKYDRNRYELEQSSVIEGGNSRGISKNDKAIIKGSTHVFLSGNASVWDVQAGGRSGYTQSDATYLEITGKAVVRHIACGTITDGAGEDNNHPLDVRIFIGGESTVANIYGAGFDTTYYPDGKYVTKGTIEVTMAGGKVGNVFGGGYRGSVGGNGLTIALDLNAGMVYGNVYGGGSGGLDKIRHDSNGGLSDGTKGKYLKSTGVSYVYGDIFVNIAGAEINGNVYGGGMSVPKMQSYGILGTPDQQFEYESVNVATVVGNTTVTIDEGSIIHGSVYGGGKGIDLSDTMNASTLTTVNMNKLGDEEGPFFQLPWFSTTEAPVYDQTVDYREYGKVTKNSVVIINGGTIDKDVYGGGAQGIIEGSSTVEINGGTIHGNVFGGGFGAENVVAVSGNRTVYITGKKTESGSSTKIGGSVYGGSSNGDDGPKNDFNIDIDGKYTTNMIVIDCADITGSVFGGGFRGTTYGNTEIYIGYYMEKANDGTYSSPIQYEYDVITGTKPISVKSIYAGGNVKIDGTDVTNETELGPNLVKGYGNISIYGTGSNGAISINGSIMGSGNASETELDTELKINSFTNRSTGAIAGIHRFDVVTITKSSFEVSGRGTVTDNNYASFYSIGVLKLENDSAISISASADNVGQLESLLNNDYTKYNAPSNSLIIKSGSTDSTFNVKNNNVAGLVYGYILLSTEGESDGAYVLCDIDSRGGFVVSKDGKLTYADVTKLGNDTNCWYIGGTEKKSITMNLKAGSTGTIESISESVQIMKMSDSTTVEYIGGEFTALSSSGVNDYVFGELGNNPAAHEFELRFGTQSTDPQVSTLVADNNNHSVYFGQSLGDASSIPFTSGDKGFYTLNLTFKGAPANMPAYLGYITLYFKEIKTIQEGNVSYSKPTNDIEVRVDLYVIQSSNNSALGVNYDVKVKTEKDGNKTSGYSDVLFPKINTMADLELKRVANIPNGVKVTIYALSNQDNTTGWMLPSKIELTSADNGTIDDDILTVNDKIGTIGTLSGSSVANIRYYVEYEGEWKSESNIKLAFNLNGQTSVVTLVVSEKSTVKVTFKGMNGNVNNQKVLEYYQGSKLSEIDLPDAGNGFIGWYVGDTEYNMNSSLMSNITLTAKYEFTVTFDYMKNGESSYLRIPGYTTIDSNSYPIIDRFGYKLDGWYKDDGFVNKWNANEKVSNNITLYAKWTGKEVKVNFYYGQGTNWINLFGNNGYVMKTVNNTPVYATVNVGSSFDLIDPVQKKNILDYAQERLLEEMGPNKRFIRWQAYANNDPSSGISTQVYMDTILTPSMATLTKNNSSSIMTEINLYAITSSVAIKVVLDKTDLDLTKNVPDAAAVVSPPNTFYVYPSTPSNNEKYEIISDGRGGYSIREKNVLESFADSITVTIHDPEGDYEVQEEVMHYRDKYSNVWSYNGDGTYSLVRSTVYHTDGNNEIEETFEASDNYPSVYYFKDNYGNRYILQNLQKPASIDDVYISSVGYSDTYYMFTFTLNSATLSGHELGGWSIADYDGLTLKQGTVATLKVFTKLDSNDKDIIVVRTLLEAYDINERLVTIELDDGQSAKKLNDVNVDYVVTCHAVWNQLSYNVTIQNPDHGTIDVFVQDDSGKKVHVSGNTIQAHYGEVIQLIYTSSGNYGFDEWVTTGRCIVEDLNSSTTTLMVKGNCTITADSITGRLVNLTMIIDNNEISDDDLKKTKVLMHLKGTDYGYIEMTLNESSSIGSSKVYSGNIPIGEYDVCLRYGSAANYQEDVMQGGLKITANGKANFTYFVISAQIITNAVTINGDNGQETHQTTGNYTESVMKYTKYVGALDSLIFNQETEYIINNPNGELPAVEITIAPGYRYTVFEGYYDGQTFMINKTYNYHSGLTDTGSTITPDGTKTETFHLNWTRYDKPALIVVETEKLSYNVTYKLMNENGTVYKDSNNQEVSVEVSVEFGEAFLQKVPTSLYGILGPQQKTLGGWYFDSGLHQQIIGNNDLDNTRIEQAKNGLVLYGKVINGVTKNIRINLQFQNIEKNGYTTERTMVMPMLKQTDNSYLFEFTIPIIGGVDYSSFEIPAGFSASLEQGVLVITAPNEISWPQNGSVPELSLKFARKEVEIKISDIYTDSISSGQWNVNKTAVFEQEVQFPTMKKNGNGDSVIGWTASIPSVQIINKDGVFYYKVSAEDTLTDGTIEFIPIYPEKSRTVTFLTNVGTFSNGSQRYVVSTTENTVMEPGLTYDSSIYTFEGFYKGDSRFDFNSNIEGGEMLIAQWTVKTFDFSYTADSHAYVTANITKESSNGVYQMEYQSKIIIAIDIDSGYDLDVEGTMEGLGYDIGTPVKLTENGAYSWTIVIDRDISLSIKTKETTTNINFFVNGHQVYDVVLKDEKGNDIGNGQNLPLYTVVKFARYNGDYWYTDPALGESKKLSEYDNEYTVLVQDSISLYTTSSTHVITYYDWDGSLLGTSASLSNGNTTIWKGPSGNTEVDITDIKSGYIFIGWATLDENGKHSFAYVPGSVVELTNSTPAKLNLYAFYLKDGNATFQYNANGNYSSLSNDASLNQVLDQYVLDIHYSKTEIGKGHYKDTNSNGSYKYSQYASSVTFTAVDKYTEYYAGMIYDSVNNQYEICGSFTVTIIENHILNFVDPSDPDFSTVTIAKIDGQTIGDLPVRTTTENKRFVGWYLDNGTEVTADMLAESLPTGTLEVKAVWVNIYTVTFNVTGGVMPEGFNSTVMVEHGNLIPTDKIPMNPTKQLGSKTYKFNGWHYAPENSSGLLFDFSTPITKSITLIADWSADNPEVRIEFYSLKGGKDPVLMNTVLEYKGAYVSNPGNPPSQRGLNYIGWCECTIDPNAVNGYTPKRDANDQPIVFDFDSPVSEGCCLVPLWAPKSYNITLYPNDGSTQVSQNIQGAKIGTPTEISMSREGYNLKGWSTTPDGEAQILGSSISVPLNANIDPSDSTTIVLYAVWEKKTYTVSYVIGDEVVATQTVEHGSTTSVPTITKDDRRVSGSWQYNSSNFNFETPITSNITLTNTWKMIYTLTLDLDGGSITIGDKKYSNVAIIKKDEGESVTFGIPTKTDTDYKSFTFTNWYNNFEMTNVLDHDEGHEGQYTVTLSSDKTLYAKWDVTVKAYDISFYSAIGGQDPQKRNSVLLPVANAGDTKFTAVLHTPDPQNGLIFSGWYEFEFISKAPGYKVIGERFTNDTVISHDYQLIAVWTPLTYEITLVENFEGSLTETVQTFVQKYNVSEVVKLNLEGCALQGWSAYPSSEILFENSIHFPLQFTSEQLPRTQTGDTVSIKLYAHWSKTYEVQLDLDDGSEPQVLVLDAGQELARPDDPSREGCRFLYWYNADGNDEAFVFDRAVDVNVHLKAKWQETCIVTYVSEDEVYWSETIDKGTKATPPADPEGDDYTFIFWHLEGVNSGFDFENTVINENTKLYAEWTDATKHMVRFYGQPGGVLELKSSILVNDGSFITEPQQPEGQERMTFMGWYEFTTTQTRSVNIIIGEKVDFSKPVTKDMNIVANWQLDVYTINFDPNGGSGNIADMHESIYGGPISLPTQGFTRDGMSFIGWSDSRDGGVTYRGNMMIRPLPEIESKTITLYAVWTDDYVVTFDSNGGSAVAQCLVHIGSKAVRPADPTWDNHTFNGWFLGDTMFDFDTVINGNITLTAKWTEEQREPEIPEEPERPSPQSPKDVQRESQTIQNADGSTTKIDKETITEKDGSRTEKVAEKTIYDDGSSFEKERKTTTDRNGNTITEIKETSVSKDERGNSIEDTVKTVTDGKSTKTEERLIITDETGRTVEENVKVINTDSDGKQTSFTITGDSEKVEAHLPDTTFEVLREAETFLDDITTNAVELVFSSESGEVIIPSDYLKEATLRDYTISLDNNEKRVSLDEATVKNLSNKGGDVVLSMKRVDPADLTERQREIISDNYAMALTITINSENISALGGTATVSVQCDQAYDHVYYVGSDGEIEEIECSYDSATGIMTFTLVHFSIYTMTDGPLVLDERDDTVIYAAIVAAILIVIITAVAIVIKKR